RPAVVTGGDVRAWAGAGDVRFTGGVEPRGRVLPDGGEQLGTHRTQHCLCTRGEGLGQVPQGGGGLVVDFDLDHAGTGLAYTMRADPDGSTPNPVMRASWSCRWGWGRVSMTAQSPTLGGVVVGLRMTRQSVAFTSRPGKAWVAMMSAAGPTRAGNTPCTVVVGGSPRFAPSVRVSRRTVHPLVAIAWATRVRALVNRGWRSTIGHLHQHIQSNLEGVPRPLVE